MTRKTLYTKITITRQDVTILRSQAVFTDQSQLPVEISHTHETADLFQTSANAVIDLQQSDETKESTFEYRYTSQTNI